MLPEDRKRLGITDGLIRVSIGIEATEDLIEDFGEALEALRKISLSH
jgi:cystathionine beta-lyase/cystathionine gamma-synthase